MGLNRSSLTTGKMHLADGLTLATQTGAQICHHNAVPGDEAWVISDRVSLIDTHQMPRDSHSKMCKRNERTL